MNKNFEFEKELSLIGNYIEKVYNSSKDNENFHTLDKLVDKYCDLIDQYGIMYLSDCVLYMNIKLANDFKEEVKSFSNANNINIYEGVYN